MTAESWSTQNTPTGKRERESERFGRTGNWQQTLADKMHELAQTISRKASATQPDTPMAQYGHQASEMLDESAEYLKQLNLQDVQVQVRDYIKKNPGQSLAIAGVAGLVIGAFLRRR